jgi:hypothetical protein
LVHQRLAIVVISFSFVNFIALSEAYKALLLDEFSKRVKAFLCVFRLLFAHICILTSTNFFAVFVKIDIHVITAKVHKGHP